MKKTLITSAVICAISVGMAGCGATYVDVPTYTPTKRQIVLTPISKLTIQNGFIVFADGKRMFDKDGDIVQTFEIGDKTFYILKQKNSTLVLKDIKGNVIEDFEADIARIYNDNKDIYIAVGKKYSKKHIFNFIYKFDGKKLIIVNKNVPIQKRVHGIYNFDVYYGKSLDRFENEIMDIRTGEYITLPKDFRHFIGAIGERIFYTTKINAPNNNMLKTFVPSTGENLTLFQGHYPILQLLRHKNQIVIRAFEDKTMEPLSVYEITGTMPEIPKSVPSRYISLNTLEEVGSISSDFKPILLYWRSIRNSSDRTLATYSTSDIEGVMFRKQRRRSLNPIF